MLPPQPINPIVFVRSADPEPRSALRVRFGKAFTRARVEPLDLELPRVPDRSNMTVPAGWSVNDVLDARRSRHRFGELTRPVAGLMRRKPTRLMNEERCPNCLVNHIANREREGSVLRCLDGQK